MICDPAWHLFRGMKELKQELLWEQRSRNGGQQKSVNCSFTIRFYTSKATQTQNLGRRETHPRYSVLTSIHLLFNNLMFSYYIIWLHIKIMTINQLCTFHVSALGWKKGQHDYLKSFKLLNQPCPQKYNVSHKGDFRFSCSHLLKQVK